MIKVISQAPLTIFIGDDEPSFNIIKLNLGLFVKGYYEGAITDSREQDSNGNLIPGRKIEFTKQLHASTLQYNSPYFFTRKTNTPLLSTQLVVSKMSRVIDVSLTIESFDDNDFNVPANIISRCSRHVEIPKDTTLKFPSISCTVEMRNFNLEDKSKILKFADHTVDVFKDFEQNFKHLYPILILRNFLYSQSRLSKITIPSSTVEKILKHYKIIENISMPIKSARDRFIEICEIFQNNKAVYKLKAKNVKFVKYPSRLLVYLLGILIIDEKEFGHFRYFDHPAINFCADYLDKSGSFDSIESKISNEIITRM